MDKNLQVVIPQSTPDTAACSMLTIQSVTGHTTPANTSFPAARYTDCNDVTSVNDLKGVNTQTLRDL